MTDEIFAIYRDANLSLNTWPYLRSYLSDTLGLMHWSPFTLPVVKMGSPQQAKPSEASRDKPIHTRKPSKKG